MAKGKRYPNWKEKVKEWESSNKNSMAWCRENKIAYTTFRGWKARLDKSNNNKNSIKPQKGFIELKDQDSPDPSIVLEY